ncbi:hypothetical protein D3C77_155220 [compost metagenome]
MVVLSEGYTPVNIRSRSLPTSAKAHPSNRRQTDMDDHSAITADTLELLLLNQQALRAGIEELSLWIKQRGSTNVHDNVLAILHTLDTNADGIASGIESLRSL